MSLSVIGCDQTAQWDREYACNGQEQSVTSVMGEQAAGFRKQYPMTIDFHVRADRALVKSYQTRVESAAGGVLQFATRGNGSRLSGQFDPRDNTLSTYESRALQVDGRAQEVVITGQYQCGAITARTGV